MVEPLGHDLRCALLTLACPYALAGQRSGPLEGPEDIGANELIV